MIKTWIEFIAGEIVRRRKALLPAMLVIAVLSALLSLRVEINSDMTKYLPDSSSMKQGIDLMAEEFSSLTMPSTIRVMVKNLPEEKTEDLLASLKAVEGADTAVLTNRAEAAGKKDREADVYTLFTVTTSLHYRTDAERALERGLAGAGSAYDAIVRNDDTMGMDIPLHLYAIVVMILLAVLFALCGSWIEPFLFLATIGIAILINMGTNLILGSVSQTTYSMAAILQLILSMDYSIILMNRFRQEKGRLSENGTGDGAIAETAMARALKTAFPSIASSGFTTFVGLLMLVFMKFKIGKDLGLVLAKGVLCSMLCVWLVLPCLILLFDSAIEKTQKRTLHLPTRRLADFSYRFRSILTVFFLLLFAFSYGMQSRAGISYSLRAEDPIADVFPPENMVVLLYSNEDEEKAAVLGDELTKNKAVNGIYAYGNTIGKQLTAEELPDFVSGMADDPAAAVLMPEGFSADLLQGGSADLIYSMSGRSTMSVEELAAAAASAAEDNVLIAALLPDSLKDRLEEMTDLLGQAKAQMVGEKHSMMMIRTSLPVESEETSQFIEALETDLDQMMTGDWYLIGNSPMSVEMARGFGQEFLVISLLTAFSIFMVVLVTFRKLLIPIILVSLVQCGVFLTISSTWVLGYRIYYLAVLIVQCILMGATVDYGILFTGYYREIRFLEEPGQALRETYARSIHTILTSGLFMIFGTGTLAVSPVDPTIGQICQSISLGALSATLLVIFILPGMLAALDRFVAGKSRDSKKEG